MARGPAGAVFRCRSSHIGVALTVVINHSFPLRVLAPTFPRAAKGQIPEELHGAKGAVFLDLSVSSSSPYLFLDS
jgi:hypothetical protein